MIYTLLISLCIGILVFNWMLRKKQRNNFERNAELKVQVVVDQNAPNQNKLFGSIIFQLPHHTENIKEVVITSVKSSNRHMKINNFDQLNFFISARNEKESALRSIRFHINARTIEKNRHRQEKLIIKGFIFNAENKQYTFQTNCNYSIAYFNEEVGNINFTPRGELAI